LGFAECELVLTDDFLVDLGPISNEENFDRLEAVVAGMWRHSIEPPQSFGGGDSVCKMLA
jgi:hypothetical protein